MSENENEPATQTCPMTGCAGPGDGDLQQHYEKHPPQEWAESMRFLREVVSIIGGASRPPSQTTDAITVHEWLIEGQPDGGYPPYRFTYRSNDARWPGAEAEAKARDFVGRITATWPQVSLKHRTITSTAWRDPEPVDPDDGGPCALWYREGWLGDDFELFDSEREAARAAVIYAESEDPWNIHGIQFPDGRTVPVEAWMLYAEERELARERRMNPPKPRPAPPVLQVTTSPFTGEKVNIDDVEWNLPWIDVQGGNRG